MGISCVMANVENSYAYIAMTMAIMTPAGIASVQKPIITLQATISKGTKAASKATKLY